MSKDMPRYRIAVYTPDQTLPTMVPSIDSFGDIMAGRIEDIREVCYADGCTCFHCGALVGGMGGVEIANNLTAHYRECEKHPLAIENRKLQAEADELRKVLWFYAETKDYDGGYRAIEVLQRFPGNQEKKIVVEGVQPK
jgi:hypothetical protein